METGEDKRRPNNRSKFRHLFKAQSSVERGMGCRLPETRLISFQARGKTRMKRKGSWGRDAVEQAKRVDGNVFALRRKRATPRGIVSLQQRRMRTIYTRARIGCCDARPRQPACLRTAAGSRQGSVVVSLRAGGPTPGPEITPAQHGPRALTAAAIQSSTPTTHPSAH